MTRRIALLGGLLLVSGCFGDGDKSLRVSPDPFGGLVPNTQRTRSSYAPATEALGKHVSDVGDKLVRANPQIGMRPLFFTAGIPQPEIFHEADGATFQNPRVVITEGLVKLCRGDAQLAAVLAMEVGKLISEREAATSAAVRQPDYGPPPDVPVGNDCHTPFGSSDGTRYVELAKYERARHHMEVLPPPRPEVLARIYLEKAGYSATDLSDVQPLLRQAEDHCALEKQLKGAPPGGK